MLLLELKRAARNHIDELAKATPFKEKQKRMKADKIKRVDDYMAKKVKYIEAQRLDR